MFVYCYRFMSETFSDFSQEKERNNLLSHEARGLILFLSFYRVTIFLFHSFYEHFV